MARGLTASAEGGWANGFDLAAVADGGALALSTTGVFATRNVCRQFIMLCRQFNLFADAIVAIDGSKFKAEHNRVQNCTPAKMQRRLDRQPEMMRLRRQAVEHAFGTIKSWMEWTHFLTKTLARVRTEMSLHDLGHFQPVGVVAQVPPNRSFPRGRYLAPMPIKRQDCGEASPGRRE